MKRKIIHGSLIALVATLPLLAPITTAYAQPSSAGQGWQSSDSTLFSQQSDTLRFFQGNSQSQNFNPFNQQQDPEEASRQRQLMQLRNTARQFEFMGQHERALDLYQRMYEEDPSDRQAFDGLRRNLSALGRYVEVEVLIRDRLANPVGMTDRAGLLAELGGAIYESGEYERADSIWAEAINVKPVSDRNFQEVASVQLRLRLLDEAIDTYLQGREQLGSDSRFSVNLAGLYTSQMNWEDASSEYLLVLRENDRRMHYVRRGLANFPDDPQANQAVIQAIENELKDTRRKEPWPGHRITLHELLIDQMTKNGDYPDALESVVELAELEGGNADRLLRYASDTLTEGYEDVASSALDEAAKYLDDPEGLDVIDLMRAQIALSREQFVTADSLLTLVLEDPASTRVERSALMSRGLVRLQHLDQAKEAVRDFRVVRTLGWPVEDRRLDYYQAVALVRIDSLSAALEPLRRVVPVDDRTQSGTLGYETEDGVITDADLNHLAARILLWRDAKDEASALLDSILSPPVGAPAENETLQLLHLVTTVEDTAALDLYAEADQAQYTGHLDTALSLFDSLAANEQTPEVLAVEAGFTAAMLRLIEQSNPDAVVTFANRYPGHPRVEEAWYQLGRWWRDHGNASEAAVAYEMVLMEAPDGLLQALARLRLEELDVEQFLTEPAENGS